jgi:hypothetical protein
VATATLSVAGLERSQRARRITLTAAGVVAAILLGLAAGALGKTQDAIGLGVALALPIIWWCAPTTGVITLLGCSAVIEQYQYAIPGKPGLDAFTDKIPFFASFQGAFHLSGLVFSPADLSIVLLLLIWLTRGVTRRELSLPRSQFAAVLGVMVLLAGVAWLRGLGLGGADTRAAFWEIRPWAYMGATYLFASQFITTRRAFRAALWTLVLGSGFKAIQGVYIWSQSRGINLGTAPALLAHEESFFFAIFVMLTVGLWIFRQRGALRITATALLPLVLVADFANARRDAVLVLGAGMLVMLVLICIARPERRQLLRRVTVVTLLVGAVYLPLEWNGSGTLAEPAQAIRSAIAPSFRDQASNQYRLEEDANIGYNVRNGNPLLGTGFGIPIDYGYVPIVNIQNVDAFILWVPHNGVLYVWMRMGTIGEFALWLLVAAAVLQGTRASRSADPEVALFGALVAGMTVGWLAMGYTDMGFFWFRIAMVFGGLLGLLHAVVSRDPSLQPAAERAAAGSPKPAPVPSPVTPPVPSPRLRPAPAPAYAVPAPRAQG